MNGKGLYFEEMKWKNFRVLLALISMCVVTSACCRRNWTRDVTEPSVLGEPRGFELMISEEKSLQSLAESFMVDVQELAALNGISTDAILSPGDRITIPPQHHSFAP